MPYNLTGIGENATNLLGLMQGVNNTLTGGWLGVFFLIGLSVIIFMAFITSTNDPKRSFAATGYINFVATLLLMAAGLIPNTFVIFISLIVAATAVAISFKS